MYIIQKNSSDNGGRPSLQPWNSSFLPDNYVFCPDNFYEIFYSTNPAGFVDLKIENNTVISMSINQQALNDYNDFITSKEKKLPPASEIEKLQAKIDYLSMMTGINMEE